MKKFNKVFCIILFVNVLNLFCIYAQEKEYWNASGSNAFVIFDFNNTERITSLQVFSGEIRNKIYSKYSSENHGQTKSDIINYFSKVMENDVPEIPFNTKTDFYQTEQESGHFIFNLFFSNDENMKWIVLSSRKDIGPSIEGKIKLSKCTENEVFVINECSEIIAKLAVEVKLRRIEEVEKLVHQVTDLQFNTGIYENDTLDLPNVKTFLGGGYIGSTSKITYLLRGLWNQQLEQDEKLKNLNDFAEKYFFDEVVQTEVQAEEFMELDRK